MKLIEDAECAKFRKEFPEEFATYGCGPGGIGDWFVPDKMWGLSVRPACQIHDWAYRHSEGCSEKDRQRHDLMLRDNCRIIVDCKSKSILLKYMRYIRINTYYVMVRLFGKKVYWNERQD